MKLLITDKLFKRPRYRETVSHLILLVSCGSYSVIYIEFPTGRGQGAFMSCLRGWEKRLPSSAGMNTTFIISTKSVCFFVFSSAAHLQLHCVISCVSLERNLLYCGNRKLQVHQETPTNQLQSMRTMWQQCESLWTLSSWWWRFTLHLRQWWKYSHILLK